MSLIIEVRSAEGGDDSKDLIKLQYKVYQKASQRYDFIIEEIDNRESIIVFKVSGPGAKTFFKHEAGGIRWQRVPPTEKRGRVHTSTITVAVLENRQIEEIKVSESELDWSYCRGSGSGGQKRNVTDSAVQLKHKPTGIQIRVESERSQYLNKETALRRLKLKLYEEKQKEMEKEFLSKRKKQVGSGMRGDKVRTIRMQDNQVKDHSLDKKTSLKKYMKGDFSDLR